MSGPVVGSIVASKDNTYHLRSGAQLYPLAIVVQQDPIVLVSPDADMRWQSTVQPDKLCIIGIATKKELDRCMTRLKE